MFEKMAEWGIVKYFGSLINPDVLGKRISKIVEMYESNTFMKSAKRLFFWAIVIILIATAIDLTFYWMRPEQKERLLKTKDKLLEYKDRFMNRPHSRGRQNKR